MPNRRHSMVAAVSLVSAVALAGCAGSPLSLSSGGSLETGSLAEARPDPAGSASGRGDPVAAKATDAKDGKTAAILGLARELRAKGDRAKALAELEKGRKARPGDRELARDAGFIALELGQLDKAKSALEASLDPARPDWQTVSALGTAFATEGKQREAQVYFRRALRLKPDHQPLLNNLALSYALDGNLAEAEKMLKAATTGGSASPQIHENLALVMALGGKYEEAEKLATKLMPKDKAKANMVYVRSMTQQGS